MKGPDEHEAKAGRLRMARSIDGRFDRAAGAARALAVPEPTYQAHENGARGFPVSTARRYAEFYQISLEWLLTGSGTPKTRVAPIVGRIGAGGEIKYIKGFANGETDNQPLGFSDCVAARIDGDSQFPLRNGWLIFWRSGKGDNVPEDCIGQLCVAKIKNGKVVMKEVRRGTRGRFNLLSWTMGPTMENVELEWAAKVIEIRPK